MRCKLCALRGCSLQISIYIVYYRNSDVLLHTLLLLRLCGTWFLPCKWCVILAYLRMFPFQKGKKRIFFCTSFPLDIHLKRWLFSLTESSTRLRNDICLNGSLRASMCMCMCMECFMWKILKSFYFRECGIICNRKIVNCVDKYNGNNFELSEHTAHVPYCCSVSTHYWIWHGINTFAHCLLCTRRKCISRKQIIWIQSLTLSVCVLNTFHFGFRASDRVLSARQPTHYSKCKHFEMDKSTFVRACTFQSNKCNCSCAISFNSCHEWSKERIKTERPNGRVKKRRTLNIFHIHSLECVSAVKNG